MSFAAFAVCAAFVSACAPQAQAPADPLAALAVCEAAPETPQSECKVEADGVRLHVRLGDTASAEVIGADGAVTQTLAESGAAQPIAPWIEDVDGDGHADVVMPLIAGNANIEAALWRFDPATNAFVRLGEVSGVARVLTADRYLAVPSRGGAASWEVSFYRFDPAALTPLATVEVTADGDDQGRATNVQCRLGEAPGIASLNLTPAAAQTKFCAEPAARVFD